MRVHRKPWRVRLGGARKGCPFSSHPPFSGADVCIRNKNKAELDEGRVGGWRFVQTEGTEMESDVRHHIGSKE